MRKRILFFSLILFFASSIVIKGNCLYGLTTQQQTKKKSVDAIGAYNYDTHVLKVKIINYSSKTVKKVAIIIRKKDMSYNYALFDTRQYKYETKYLDVSIPSGNSAIKELSVYIDNEYKFEGVALDWARDSNNNYIY